MPRTKEEARQTKEKIIKAALQLFEQSGVEKTTFVNIGQKAGYTRGAVYVHFKDKDEILQLIFERHREKLSHKIEAISPKAVSNLHFLEKLAVEFFKTLKSDREFYLVERLLNFDHISLSSVQEMNRRFELEDFNDVKKCFEDALAQKEINEGLSPEFLTIEYLSLIGGIEYFYLKKYVDFDVMNIVTGAIERFFKSIRK